MKHLLLIIFLFTSTGCSEFITYTIVSAGTLTGRIAHDQYNEHFGEAPVVQVKYHYDRPNKEKKDDDNSGTERVQKR